MREPLNGTKTHPLTPVAKAVIEDLKRGPIPYSQINAGIIDRLDREGLIEVVDLPSPFKVHKGGNCRHVRLINELG